jgi:hypothetical protein
MSAKLSVHLEASRRAVRVVARAAAAAAMVAGFRYPHKISAHRAFELQ